ncbi:MAG: class F sortase [Thermomicrobiales bacterium]
MTTRFPEDDALRLGRRTFVLGAAGAAGALPFAAFAQDDANSDQKNKDKKKDDAGEGGKPGIAEVPSFGARRPGPVEPGAGKKEPKRKVYQPVQLTIPDAAVDAPVEVGTITPDGVMLDPTGAWIVTWYDVLGSPGEGGNIVMAGHLDYFGIPQAVFYYVPNLAAGTPMSLTMADGTVFTYALDWIQIFAVADLTPDIIAANIVGDTGDETLTLITCGGQLNADMTEYLSRYVVRATKI